MIMKTLHTIFTNFAKRSAMLLTLLLAVGIGQAWGAEATYTKVTSAPADWSGEYIVVYESDNTAYVWTGVDAAKCNTTTTISNNSVTGDFVTVTIAQMTGGYSIKVNSGTNSGKYIYGTSGSNKLNFGTSAQLNTLSYETDWVKITSNTSVLTFNNNSNDMRFRYYKSSSYSGQQHIQLYKLSTGGGGDSEPCDNPTVSWSTEPADGEVGGSMTASVTTNYSDGLTYSSSNQDVATISTAGVISYLAAGTATITATVTGDGTTICEGPVSVEQEITVTAAGGSGGESGDCTWEETDISAISSTDIVIITMTNSDGTTYAMSNNNGASSAPSAVNVTITDGKLSTEENIKWNVGGTTNAYVFYPEGSDNNLYCTNANNGVRVGTSTENTFKIDTESGYLVHNGTGRYIGVYNSQDWRCYTSIHANIADQTLKFYKQVCPVVEYTVTYKANGGTGNDVETTTSKVADCTFARNGYNFTGWNTEADGSGDSYDVDSEVTSDLILYAQWEIINYTITYYLNDGTNNNANPETYTIETETIALQDPSRNGYTFGGWYSESTFTNQVTQIAKGSTGNITLHAKWTLITYDITYELDGGTNHASNPATYTIETATITLQAPSKFGHTFSGWYRESTFTNQVTQITNGSTGDITLYAQWTEKALTNYRTACDIKCVGAYSFHTGTGTDDDVKNTENITCFTEYGVEQGTLEHEWQIRDYTIPADDKFFVGYLGYFYNDNLGVGNQDGDKSRSVISDWNAMYHVPSMDEDDTNHSPRMGLATGAVGTLRIFDNSDWDNLFVGFIPEGYKLKFGDNEYALTLFDSENHDYRTEELVQYTAATFANSVSVGVTNATNAYVATANTQEMRHIFLKVSSNWASNNAKFSIYDIGAEAFKSGFMKLVPGETDIYEGWIDKNCEEIIFVRHSSDATSPSWDNDWSQTGNITQIPLEQNMLTINGWGTDQISGWTTLYEKYGKFRMYNNSKDVNWYVHFYPYNVLIYDANGGTGTMDMQSVPADADDQSVIIAANGFSAPDGYRFVGWNTAADGSGTPYAVGAEHTLSDDLTLYAQWAQEFTVTYEPNGGTTTCVDNNLYIQGETVTVCADEPTRTGYTFLGWQRSDNSNTVQVSNTFTMPAANVTLTAQWQINTYTVTWNPNGGNWEGEEANKVDAYNYGATITKPADPTRDGYRFDGWHNGTAIVEPETTMGTSALTYTAQWTQIHTIKWLVGGAPVHTEEVANTQAITETPGDDPLGTAIGDCANTFVGWSESNLGSAEGQPAPTDLCTAEEMKAKYTSVTGDKTFYAVFATNSGGGGQTITWVKTALDAVTEGVYALLTTDGNAFNGTISSGHGLTTTEAFSFTDGVATFAPEGTCEITFTTSSKGFTMYNSATSKYLYAKDDASGNLAWQDTESSYWYLNTYNGNNWTYKAKEAVLRSNSGNIRTYGNNTGDRLVLAKKTITGIPPSYSNYVTSCCGLVPVTDVVVSDITANSAKLTWTAPNTTTGITELEIRNAETDDVLADDIDVNATSATISGLDNCTTYSVYVVSVGECDAKSQIVSFTTLLSDPKTVTFVYGNGEENSTATTNCESSSITLPTPSWTGYRFLGWYDAPSGGDKIGDGGASYTPANDITLYAHWEELARFTVTYSVGSGDTAPAAVEALDGSSITVPALESNLYCVSFVGWTDAATYSHGTSALYEAGDSYTVTSNVTLKAVYAEGTGYVLVEDVANLAANDKVIIVSAEADSDGKYWALSTTQNSNNRGQVEVQVDGTTVQLVSGVEVLTLETGTVADSWAFNTGEGYLCAVSTDNNYLKTQTTNDENGSWSIAIAEGVTTIIAHGEGSHKWMRYNANNDLFACYKESANDVKDVSIYKENITGYTTSPACTMYNVTLCTPDNGTLSVDKNPVEPYGSAVVTFTPESGYMLQTVTLTYGTAEQGATSYLLNNPTGTAKVTFSNIQSDIEVCATFVAIPLYTVTFVDMNDNNSQTPKTQVSYGAAITAPSTASDPCDDTWKFVGWAPNSSIQGSTDVPTGLILPGGTISGEDITDNSLKYYSVYTNQNNGTLPFAIGKSGTYYFKVITENAVEYYAYDEINSSHRYPGTGTTKIPFELTYNNVTAKYTIKNTLTGKYLSPNYDDGNEIYELDASYDWDIMQPTLYADAGTSAYAKTGEYLFHYTNVAGNFRALYYTSYFESAARDEDYYALYLEPATATYYYNRSDCSTSDVVTMTFYNPFGNEGFSWTAGYPVGYYTNVPKGTTIEYFPTMEYNGWAFIGWTDTDYNQGKILDDENSTSDIPADIKIYNNTAGLTYSLTSDVTMYPLFTKYDDNTDVDLENGGEYYMYFYQEGDYYKDDYFGLDNHYQRVYAADGGGEGEFGYTFNCSAAQLFEFIKDGDGWNIRVKNADGTYPTKSYLVNTSENDYDLVASEPSDTWSITKTSEGDYQMWYRGNEGNSEDNVYYQAKAREYSGGTSWDFKCYNQDNDASAFYYKVYLGTCENRVFSSNPSNKPAITMNGEPMVTSTSEQSIRSAKTITISATKLAANGIVTLTSDNSDVYFATDIAANFTKASKPVTPLTITADEDGKVEMTTVYVHYKPTSSSALGTQTVTITATTGTEGQEDYATATTTAHVRNLPTDFVIAAKWGDNWYAMPADMDSQSSTEGWLIEVDDATNPTKANAAPNTTKYGLKSVYTSNSTADRFEANGEKLVFVENVEETTPVANKTLYNGGGSGTSNTNIQVYAQYTGYYSTNPDCYEWTPATTDLVDYTLTSGAILSGDTKARTVSLDAHGEFGTLLQNKAYNGMVRLLPVDNFYETVELQVVEWKQNSVSVMYTGAGTKYTTQVGNNAESSVQPLSKIDHAVYSLSTGDLTTATNQPLIITIKNDADAIIGAVKLTIPAIVATDKSSTELSVTAENAKATNIVILDGATLTAGTTKYTYNDVVVYPGGNLVIDTDGKLGMYTLTLRAGSSWGVAEYEHKYPQFLLKGDYSNSSGQINLDYVTTQDYYYPLSVPEKVTIGDIKYPVDIYGSNVDKANSGSFQLKYYDGAQRVDQGSQYGTGWVVVDETKTQTLTPNQGYAIWGIPKKINGTRQTYGIHRIPIKKAASDLITNETTTEEIAITAHGDASTPPNDRGWNYLGNPYLAGLGTNDDTDVQMGLLVQEMIDGKWTGGWVNNGEQVRYVTLTNDCQNFEALPVSEATIQPFTTFFVQAAQTGAIALNAPTAVAATASVVARRYAAQQETAKEITTGILLTGNDQTDRTGLLIADNFTEEYDYNADLSKFENSGINLYTIGKTGNLAYMAINQALAEQPIPVGYTAPAEGLYTIAFDEDRYNATDISALYLIDYDSNEKTNLLHTDYSFVTAAGTNNQRFALQVAFAPANATNIEWVGDATIQVGVEGNTLMLNNLPTDAAVHVFDALGRLMYHAPTVPTEMQLTLPTGYYLVRIADKQNAVVIKTVIP